MKKILITTLLVVLFFVCTGVVGAENEKEMPFGMNFVSSWRTAGGVTSILEKGSSGTEVVLLQYLLSRHGEDFYPERLITGFFGSVTEDALKKWQQIMDIDETGVVCEKTGAAINAVYMEKMCPLPKEQFNDKKLFPINKELPLPHDYIPQKLVDLRDFVRTTRPECLEEEAAQMLQEMFLAAEEEGYVLAVTSGFRSHQMQDIVHRIHLNRSGNLAYDFSAMPGYSEHQLGTAVDLTSQSLGFLTTRVSFTRTDDYTWLKENAYKFGFVLSYPNGSKEVTGYIYEPWHWRYIGKDHAQKIFGKDIFLAEYLDSTYTGRRPRKVSSLDELLMRIDSFLINNIRP